MRAIAKNGVLVLASVTGGDKRIEIPADKINLEFVLGNKLLLGTINALREDFEHGVSDMVRAQAVPHAAWRASELRQICDAPTNAKDAVKVYCVVGRRGTSAGSDSVRKQALAD